MKPAYFTQAQVLGRVVRDPKFTETESGRTVCEFTLAGTYFYKSANGVSENEKYYIPVTTWPPKHSVEAYKRWLTPNRRVLCCGRLRQRECFSTESDSKYNITEIVATSVVMVDNDAGEEWTE